MEARLERLQAEVDADAEEKRRQRLAAEEAERARHAAEFTLVLYNITARNVPDADRE